ncbi:hypothetical protein FNAPI_649 [Fusarium napiforme]|uniref:Uncharacterized protein n=1 Tax=Fusarium napiforme TaxID=42672 RepID=A0A8H5K4C8_9HYPO|nr:hypothetical protein FNAPI_649 [Fusarium napiforme]
MLKTSFGRMFLNREKVNIENVTTFIASPYTLAPFSVLGTAECCLNIITSVGDDLVTTGMEQRAAGMGEYHDAEFPLRAVFTEVPFNLVDKLLGQLTSAPVRAYVAAEKAGRSFRMINPKHESIQDEPCWKLGGFGMCCASQSGQLLGANNDAEYIKALEESSFAYLMFVSAFLTKSIRHKQKMGGVDLLASQKSIYGETTQAARDDSGKRQVELWLETKQQQ